MGQVTSISENVCNNLKLSTQWKYNNITYGQVPDRLRCGMVICSVTLWSDNVNSTLLLLISMASDTLARNCPQLSLWSSDVFTLLFRALRPLDSIVSIGRSSSDNVDIFNSEFHSFLVHEASEYLCVLISSALERYEPRDNWCTPFEVARHLMDIRWLIVFACSSIECFGSGDVFCVRRLDQDCLYGICPLVLNLLIAVGSMLLWEHIKIWI